MLASFLSREFLLHTTCWLRFYLGIFSYTSRAGFIFIGEFLLHISCWLHYYLGSFSYRSHAGFTFLWGVSLTHPLLTLVLSGEFLLHIQCWLNFYLGSFPCWFHFCPGSFSYTSSAGFTFIWVVSRAGFIFVRGVSLSHPTLASFLSSEFLLHIPCWL